MITNQPAGIIARALPNNFCCRVANLTLLSNLPCFAPVAEYAFK